MLIDVIGVQANDDGYRTPEEKHTHESIPIFAMSQINAMTPKPIPTNSASVSLIGPPSNSVTETAPQARPIPSLVRLPE